jgi:hypothetical protein
MKLHFEIQRVVIGAAGVKSGLARWAGVATSQILVNTQYVLAIAAQNGFGLALGFRPYNRRVAH